MSKHTPGPWIAKSPDNDSNVLDVYPSDNSSFKLHRGYWGHKADARLIAAAPELLEVLKLVVLSDNQKIKKIHGKEVKSYTYHDEKCPCKICEVIAKAEGKNE